jgi:hypothetical protein
VAGGLDVAPDHLERHATLGLREHRNDRVAVLVHVCQRSWVAGLEPRDLDELIHRQVVWPARDRELADASGGGGGRSNLQSPGAVVVVASRRHLIAAAAEVSSEDAKPLAGTLQGLHAACCSPRSAGRVAVQSTPGSLVVQALCCSLR